MTRLSALVLGVSMAASLTGVGQAAAQTREAQRPATGTASIAGVVVTDASTPRPIRKVMVQLTDVTSGRLPQAAITDDSGAFVFRDLAPGAYTLVASRSAYVTSAYGAKTYGRGSGVPISLSAGQTIKDITLKMIRGGVIAGTLRDPAGRPAANAELILLTSRTDSGRRKMAALAQSARTDSRGEYRLFGLAPGDYVLRAQPPSRFGQQELRPTSAAEVDWARRAASGTAADPPAKARPVAYAASYYPGTSDASTATPITVGPGEERLGMDFSLQLIPTATISGRILGPDGLAPKNPSASLQLLNSGVGGFIDVMIGIASSGGFGGGVRVSNDGTFTASGVAPGRYKLTARGAPSSAPSRPGMPELAGVAMALPGLAGVSGQSLFAAEELTIAGQDVTGLDLRLEAGVTMSGTVVFEGEDPQAPVDASRVSLTLSNADREATSVLETFMGMMLGAYPGRAAKDRTFTVVGLVPARYRLAAMPPGVVNPFGTAGMVGPDGWALKSAVWKDRDLADGTFDIDRGSDVSGVVLTFTKATTEISGRLLDAAGRATSGFPIVVFSTRSTDWVGGSRRVVSAKPASDGTFRIRGLPAGEYYVCALTDLDMNDLFDPVFLEQLAGASSRITLADGEKKTQDLKLGGGL